MKNKTESIKLIYTKSNILRGALVYSAGDLIASLLLNEFLWSRFVGMLIVGATVYAFEIPNYFNWIEKRAKSIKGIKKTLIKTLYAILYFNPIWIARHLFFIKLFSSNFDGINSGILKIALWSFLLNIPISFIANYLIQNKVKLSGRFLVSAIFSGLMAIYYALSEVLFQ